MAAEAAKKEAAKKEAAKKARWEEEALIELECDEDARAARELFG